MLKNTACPDYFVGKDADDYARYRYYCLHRLPRLLFLDSKQVDDKERKEAKRVGHLVRVAKPDTQQQLAAAASQDDALPSNLRGLDELVEKKQQRAAFGVTTYQYFVSSSLLMCVCVLVCFVCAVQRKSTNICTNRLFFASITFNSIRVNKVKAIDLF